MSTPEFFRNIIQVPARWEGGSVPLPTFYRDAMAIQANVLAASNRVRALLPSPRLYPLRVTPGRCIVALVALAYRDTDLGPYEEFLVGIPVTLDQPSPQFTGVFRRLPPTSLVYVHRLPVTTAEAMNPGVHFLAAPKFLAEISFEHANGWVRCRLAEGGAEILKMGVRTDGLSASERSQASLITARDGYLLRWTFTESEQRKKISYDCSDAMLELGSPGSHAVSDELHGFRLGRVLSCEYRPRFQAILGPVVESFGAERTHAG